MPAEPPELHVVRAALAGDGDARRRLLEAVAKLPAMMRRRNARLGGLLGAHDLEDAVQGVLLALWQKLARFDGRVPLAQWAYGFGVIESHRLAERRARRREDPQPMDELAAPRVGQEVDRELLHRELARLAAGEQRVVRLKHFESLTFQQIAARIGIPVSTAKRRYYRGLGRLRARLRGRLES